MPPVRVLYVVNDLALGGAQRVILNQASRLDRDRFTPEVASLEILASGEMVPAFEEAEIPVHRLRSQRELPQAGALRLGRLFRTLRPDLVHTHLATAGICARPLARAAGVRHLVTTLHNLSDWQEQRWTVMRWLDRRTLMLADAIVTVSDAVRRAVARVDPRLEDRMLTVHNGVPLEELAGARAERNATRALLGYEPDHFVVGAVARLDPRKGIDTLVEAFAVAAAHDPKLRLLVLGDGPERDRLKNLACEAAVWDRMHMVHHQARVRSYLAAMDLFAAPSRTEGLGVAIIEALAVGLPVIASRVGGIPEVIEDGRCGSLLPAECVTEWAHAIAHLAHRPPELARWALAGPIRARAFTVEASGQALQRVYDHVLGTAEPAAAVAA